MSMMNRLANSQNTYQGDTKRVLCICSAGLLRSPTAAVVLSAEPFNFNTRAAGISEEYAMIQVDDVLLTWAQEIVCLDIDHFDALTQRFGDYLGRTETKPVLILNIPDNYRYRDPELMTRITKAYNLATQSPSDKFPEYVDHQKDAEP